MHCAQGREIIFGSLAFLEAGLAKWGRLKRIQILDWLGKEATKECVAEQM